MPPGEPHKASIAFLSYALEMENKLDATLKAPLLAAISTHPTAVETVRKVLIKHINGVKVVLQEAQMVFSLN